MLELNRFWFRAMRATLIIVTIAGATGIVANWTRVITFATLPLSIVFILCTLPFCFVKCIEGSQALVVRDRIIRTFSKDTVVWRWRWIQWLDETTDGADPLAWAACLIRYSKRWTEVSLSAHPITENPKVRALRIKVTIWTRGEPEDILALERTIGVLPFDFQSDASFCPLEEPLKSLLYEFIEKHSKDLGRFYNPCSKEQQEGFQKLALDYLREHLQKMGIGSMLAKFDMAE